MNYRYNADNNMFYAYEYRSQYEGSGDWPVDGVDVSDDIYLQFTGKWPDGKIRVAGRNGMPAWADIPPPTQADFIAAANREKSRRLSASNIFITPLQDAFDMEMATDQEQALLLAWKKYRVQLSRVNTSTAPNIEWPTQPAEPAEPAN